MTLEQEYSKTAIALKNVKDLTPHERISDREILGNMVNSTTEVAKTLKQKVFYEVNSLSEEDFSLLTARQKEVAILRQKSSCRAVAEKLSLSPKTVHETYKQAVRKIRKAQQQRESKIPVGLSPQQEKIFCMFFKKGQPKSRIASDLGTSEKTVKTQIRRIKRFYKA